MAAVVCCQCPLVVDAQAVLDSGISSIAVVLKHAAIYPEHEKMVGQLATDMGFKQVGIISGLCPCILLCLLVLQALGWRGHPAGSRAGTSHETSLQCSACPARDEEKVGMTRTVNTARCQALSRTDNSSKRSVYAV